MSDRREFDQRYASEWRSIVQFMKNNTGFSLSGIARGGSRAKGDYRDTSDLDIIFSVAGDLSKQKIYPIVRSKLKENFPQATVEIGSSYNVIKMSLGPLKFDIVLKKLANFNREIQSNMISRI